MGMQMALLIPGTTFYMMPGELAAHSVLTIEDSIASGRMFWDAWRMSDIIDCLAWISQNNDAVTNEPIPTQLPQILDLLKQRSEIQANGLEDWISKDLRPLLSCQHRGPCRLNKCPCFQDNPKRDRGCTVWCHGGQPCPKVRH
jgi:hypothetical protein